MGWLGCTGSQLVATLNFRYTRWGGGGVAGNQIIIG